MARLARVVVPDVPHHITQRGNRRQDVFFSDADYSAYTALISDSCTTNAVSCLAWCLMPNHVHLILVPSDTDGLRAALAEAHRRYSRRINSAHGWTGYLWQGRFASYPMDDTHLMNAVRYIELNPVRAGLVKRAEDWRWSSARAHVKDTQDGLTDIKALSGIYRNWKAMLQNGFSAGDLAEDEITAFEQHSRTGRPLGNETFIEKLEAQTGRALKAKKPGRKPLIQA